ncbi:unnamed protein product [Tuber melanosporum]|uniref:(Perigord truffle) hypothetical protein n=1 Tax=Tuber melanosporum (strain Mel28) TaxID=656061 RepID=D5GAQ2_TUBMM|nr:uncharacterized protein GSTUM_00003728001 [Tuber melanosporum]CAZ81595.1 unnamed protein product [Tuber melanosporum]
MASPLYPQHSRAPPVITEDDGSNSRNVYPTPNSAHGPGTFDTSLFSLSGSGNTHLSERPQPALPSLQSSTYPHTNSPLLPTINQPLSNQGHSPSLTSGSSGLSPATSQHSYYTHNIGLTCSEDPSSALSPPVSFVVDPGSSPERGLGPGYSVDTTPGFDEVDMPPLADENTALYGDEGIDPLDQLSDPYSPVNGSLGIYHPPSPRPTVSPSPAGLTASNPGGFTGVNSNFRKSPVVKVEEFTPQDNGVHPTPSSRAMTGSSSSSGAGAAQGGDNLTVNRGEDGSWKGGLDPTARREVELGLGDLPFSLKEQEIIRGIEEKNADIEDWLSRNTNLSIKPTDKRRSRSLADFRRRPMVPPKSKDDCVRPGESSSTGAVLFDEDDDTGLPGAYDYEDDDSSVASSFVDGSLDDSPEDQGSMDTSEIPPSESELMKTAEEEEAEQKRRENDPQYYPRPNQFYSAHPWNDTVAQVGRGAAIASRNQPNTANAAITKFYRYAENIETASRVATFGSQMSKSRRLSAGDADRFLANGLLKSLSFGRDKDKEKEREKEKEKQLNHQRRPSMWGTIPSRLKRGFSNAGDKEREKEKEKERLGTGLSMEGRKRGNSTTSLASTASHAFAPIKRGSSWAKSAPKSPLKVDTKNIGGAFAQMASMAAGAGQSSAHTAHTASTAGIISPPTRSLSGGFIAQTVKRARSKSDISSSKLQKGKPVFGIVSMLGQYGGPPALPIKSPVQSAESESPRRNYTFGEESRKRGIAAAKLLCPPDPHRHDGYDDDDDNDMDDDDMQNSQQTTPPGTRPPLPKLDITPNPEGFSQHVRGLTPALHPKLVDRVVYEQGKRFKKLVEHRQKHLAAIRGGKRCGNTTKCRGPVGSIGPGGDPSANGHKRNTSGGSGEGEAYSSDETVGDGSRSPTEGKVTATQFPPGVPQPPVLRLPAEFECPICFKVKKFQKPSDWTKHVHEDVQPFTCTFVECTEPKSFKRKADWVRHENERHRHLEWWTCTLPDCTHTCYRKDNFVQHLVREHKMAEPKVKAQKAAARKGKKGVAGMSEGVPSHEDFEKVWQIVDSCHQVTTKHPTQEKCRFCGNVCPTWKKLTVHLARHMEQISLPVLDLIKDDAVVPPSVRPSAASKRVQQNSDSSKPEPSKPPPPPPPPPIQQPDMEMDIDPADTTQRQLTGNGDCDVLPPPQFHSPDASTFDMSPAHLQYTPPRSSPNVDDRFGIQTPLRTPQFVSPHNFSPEQNLRMQQQQQQQQLSMGTNSGFDFSNNTGRDIYSLSPQQQQQHTPTSSGVTTPQRIATQAGGYINVSPPPQPGLQYPQHRSPLIHLVGQQQMAQQPQYFAYGHASGQVQGAHGQIHSQTVAHANAYNFYPQLEQNDLEIPGAAVTAADPTDDYINVAYTAS